VPGEVSTGRPVRDYRPDPFTRRLWLETVTPTALELKTYELERLSGRLVFDWRLASPAGAEPAGGQIVLAVDRTRGGYLAQAGAAPALADQPAFARDLENHLAEELAGQLTLALGRIPTAAEVETGDPLSREAKRLAAAGDWEGAKDLWLKLLTLNPGYAPAHFNLGLYWEYRQKPEEAWRSYREAFKSEPSRNHRAALTRLTDALALAGRRPGRS
jgi:tetratricopeptide (TPR) repeat protein